MKLSRLKIREKLICRLEGGDGKEFTVRIEEIFSDYQFAIDLPIVTNKSIRFKTGARLEFFYITSDGINVFKGQVESPNDPSEDFMRIIKDKESDKRVQRRNFFRLEITVDVMIRKFKDFFQPSDFGDRCLAENISAGGLLVNIASEDYEDGDLVFINANIGEKMLGIWSQVVSKRKNDDYQRTRKYKLGIQFLFMTPEETEELVDYVFRKQREMLKLGRLNK